jgi:hypothetical protein
MSNLYVGPEPSSIKITFEKWVRAWLQLGVTRRFKGGFSLVTYFQGKSFGKDGFLLIHV